MMQFKFGDRACMEASQLVNSLKQAFDATELYRLDGPNGTVHTIDRSPPGTIGYSPLSTTKSMALHARRIMIGVIRGAVLSQHTWAFRSDPGTSSDGRRWPG